MYEQTPKYDSEIEEIDLKDIVATLLKRKWIILLCAIVAGAAAFAFSALSPKVYKIEETLEIGYLTGPDGRAAIEAPAQVVTKN